MEHRALALEYRPQSFSEIAGQHHVTAVLSRALGHGRVHHCYLFSGPRGVGKTTTARVLAKILNCPNTKDGVPCNECEVCRDITAGVSLDVQEIDGASNRGIADVQQLREKVRFAPSGGKYRVVIIDEVHQLSADAFAALLKTLEEPPLHVVFIFATTDPLKLPDTIRSRCQRYDFGRLPLPAIVTRLQEIVKSESSADQKIEITDEAAFLLARKSEGSMRDAVSALDQVLSTGAERIDEKTVNEVLGIVSREVFFDLGEKILGRDPEGALAAMHGAYREGIDPRDLAEGILDHLRSLLVLRVDPGAQDLVVASEGEQKRFEEQGGEHETPDLLRLMRIVSESLAAMRDSAQPLTHLEIAVVEMASLEPGIRLTEVLERLGALEGGGGGGGTRRASAATKAPATKKRASRTTRKTEAPASVEGAASDAITAELETTAREPVTIEVGPDGAAEKQGAAEEAEELERDPQWDEVVHRVKERKLMVGVFLEESRRMGWEDGALLLAADEVHRSLLEAPDNRELLLTSLRDVYGRPSSVKFVAGGGRSRAARSEESGRRPSRSTGGESHPGGEGEAESGAGAGAVATVTEAPEPAIPERSSSAAPRSTPANGSIQSKRDASEGVEAETEISPAIKEAMVWFEGEIVRQSRPGGPIP